METRKARSSSKNTTRKIGGSLLGEGVTGLTFNAGCSSAGNSFCKQVRGQEDSITKILLYTPESAPIKLTKKDDLLAFVQYFRSLQDIITKILKPPPKFLKKSIQTLFHNELDANRRIIKLYGKKAEDYLTIAPIEYMSHDVIGAQVFLKSRAPMYVIFGYKCNNKFKLTTSKQLTSWTKDILQSVAILQKQSYLHNDIKPDNSVLCGKNFKLIDWGFACPMDYKSFKKSDGDDMFISPIRWIMTNTPKDIAIEKLTAKTERKNKKYFNSQIWKDTLSFIEDEVSYATSLNLSYEQLFTKYKDSLDVMMIGFTIAEVVHDAKLSWNYWKPIVYKMLSHKQPIQASAALALL